MAKRVLITGASGLLGREIYKVFKNDSIWDVVGLAFSRVKEGLTKCDITKPDEIQAIFKDFKPTVVIHAAAERRPDNMENNEEGSKLLNESATRYLCEEAKKINSVFLFISTDYVFDGKNPPYSPDDTPNPLNKYGVSKLRGEEIVKEVNPDNMVLRVPIMYGEVESLDESAVTVLFKKVLDVDNRCTMCNYLRRFPTHTADVAFVIHQLIDTRLRDPKLTGTFHWSGEENVTKFDMALTMAAVFSLQSGHIDPDNKPPAGPPRPDDAHLDTTSVERLGINQRTPFEAGIRTSLKPYFDNHNLHSQNSQSIPF